MMPMMGDFKLDAFGMGGYQGAGSGGFGATKMMGKKYFRMWRKTIIPEVMEQLRKEESIFRDPYQAAVLASFSKQTGFIEDVAKAANTAAEAFTQIPPEVRKEIDGLVRALVDVISSSLDKPAQALFDLFASNSEFLTQPECVASLTAFIPAPVSAKGRDIWNMLDTDKSGNLSNDEAVSFGFKLATFLTGLAHWGVDVFLELIMTSMRYLLPVFISLACNKVGSEDLSKDVVMLMLQELARTGDGSEMAQKWLSGSTSASAFKRVFLKGPDADDAEEEVKVDWLECGHPEWFDKKAVDLDPFERKMMEAEKRKQGRLQGGDNPFGGGGGGGGGGKKKSKKRGGGGMMGGMMGMGGDGDLEAMMGGDDDEDCNVQ